MVYFYAFLRTPSSVLRSLSFRIFRNFLSDNVRQCLIVSDKRYPLYVSNIYIIKEGITLKKMKLTTRIFLGLILGIIAGFLLQSAPEFATTYIKPFGTLFINMIKMIIVPLVFSSLIVGAASIGDIKSLGRIGGKTVLYYLLTTAVAVSIGIFLAKVLVPGAGLLIPVDAEMAGKEAPSIITTLLNIIPKNPLKGLVDGNILQVITFALFLGRWLCRTTRRKRQTVPNVFR